MSNQNPALLVQLPQPLLETGGQTQFGPCYGLTGLRKRKRFEIAAAVDGETLNIYGVGKQLHSEVNADLTKVQASGLLSSYAVSPTSSFTCSPCSIRRRHPSGSITSRHTACATQRPECQIVCFKETIDCSDTPVVSTYKHAIEGQSPVIYVDFVPGPAYKDEPEASLDIIAAQRDGTIRRVSADLQKTRWISASVPTPDARAFPVDVVFAHWVSYADACTALLRRRNDILKECAASSSSFLVLVYRDGDHQESELRMGVFEVPLALRTGITSASSAGRLRLLSSNTLPDSRRWTLAANHRFDFHASSARLSISSRKELINYNISAYAPDISSKLFFDDGHSSLFPLTGSIAAGVLRSGVQIYDMKYQSIKARFEVRAKPRSRGTEDSTRKSMRFISYFSRINTLLAVRGRNLFMFDISCGGLQKWNSSHSGNLLIDSLGRSSYASARITGPSEAELGPCFSKALSVPNPPAKAGWEARKKSLDGLVQENKVEEFEVAMASELLDEVTRENHRIPHPTLKLPSDEQFVSYDKIHYLLSKIFRPLADPTTIDEGEKGRNIAIAFFPPRLLQWLARRHHLSTAEIEIALSNECPQPQLRLGAVAYSIMEKDHSLNLMIDYLHGANLTGLDEAVTVIKVLFKGAVSWARRGSPTEQQPTVGEGGIFASKSQGAVVAGGWSRECISAMDHALEIICGFSPSKVTLAIRTHLDTEEALALIQFLRQQLFRGGYTSSFSGFPIVQEDIVLSLENTVRALSACIDAVGPWGFLDSTTDRGLWQGLVPDLKSEISLALVGIEEATYLRGVLQEMVRYGSAMVPTDSPLHRLGEPVAETGRLIRVHTEPMEEQGHNVHEPSSLLPLSLTVENKVTKTKKRKGQGEVIKRSGRELQYLKNRNIGRYSFERLIL